MDHPAVVAALRAAAGSVRAAAADLHVPPKTLGRYVAEHRVQFGPKVLGRNYDYQVDLVRDAVDGQWSAVIDRSQGLECIGRGPTEHAALRQLRTRLREQLGAETADSTRLLERVGNRELRRERAVRHFPSDDPALKEEAVRSLDASIAAFNRLHAPIADCAIDVLKGLHGAVVADDVEALRRADGPATWGRRRLGETASRAAAAREFIRAVARMIKEVGGEEKLAGDTDSDERALLAFVNTAYAWLIYEGHPAGLITRPPLEKAQLYMLDEVRKVARRVAAPSPDRSTTSSAEARSGASGSERRSEDEQGNRQTVEKAFAVALLVGFGMSRDEARDALKDKDRD